MRLYTLRHGKAGEGFPDAIRQLTERGMADVADVIAMRDDELGQLDLLLYSPLERARQTAEIVLEGIHADPRIEESTLIRPESSVEEFCDYLSGLDGNQSLMICTHNPFAADLISHLSGHLTAMPTAALAAVEFKVPARSAGRLLWLETP